MQPGTKPNQTFAERASKPAPVDWNRIWNHHIQCYRRTNRGQDCADQWQSRESAEAYWEMARQTQQHRIQKTLADLPLAPGCRVLDIGSGPGVMAIPMARRVGHVTAVDASAGMISVLSEKAGEAGVENIACVNKRWEAVDPKKDLCPPYDIVIASLSLAMYDLRQAVCRMEQVCRGRIYLYWFAGETSWEGLHRFFEPFAPECMGRAAVPKSELLLEVLRQKGIDPHLDQFPYIHLDRFRSVAEAVRHFAKRFRIPPERRGARLEKQVRKLLEPCDGGYVLRSRATCMKIWWQVSGTNAYAGDEDPPLWWN
jgi:SAM-dependent methyltransferase